jgi:hypothetical protein
MHRRTVSPLLTRRFFLRGIGVLTLSAAPGCSGSTPGSPVTKDKFGDQMQTLPRGQFPVFADTVEIQALYQYAVEQGDELQYIPCSCGCGGFGHTSNRDCYIKSFNADDTLTFTSHAAT